MAADVAEESTDVDEFLYVDYDVDTSKLKNKITKLTAKIRSFKSEIQRCDKTVCIVLLFCLILIEFFDRFYPRKPDSSCLCGGSEMIIHEFDDNSTLTAEFECKDDDEPNQCHLTAVVFLCYLFFAVSMFSYYTITKIPFNFSTLDIADEDSDYCLPNGFVKRALVVTRVLLVEFGRITRMIIFKILFSLCMARLTLLIIFIIFYFHSLFFGPLSTACSPCSADVVDDIRSINSTEISFELPEELICCPIVGLPKGQRSQFIFVMEHVWASMFFCFLFVQKPDTRRLWLMTILDNFDDDYPERTAVFKLLKEWKTKLDEQNETDTRNMNRSLQNFCNFCNVRMTQ